MEALTDALVAPTFLAPSAPTSRGIFLQGAASTARTAGEPEVGRSVGRPAAASEAYGQHDSMRTHNSSTER